MSPTSEEQPRAFSGLHAVAGRLVQVSEVLVVTASELLVIVCLIVAGGVLYTRFFTHLGASVTSLNSINDLQTAVESVFAGILLLMLGLELLKCLMSYFTGFRVQVEIILVVAMIAVARHIMLANFERTEWTTLLAAAALILALAISYTLVRQRDSDAEKPRAPR
jgi:uncharacterized membrane protein (DUF373 family)